MFEELIARVRRTQAEFEFELARTTDPYRLMLITALHKLRMETFSEEADEMVRELEEV